MNTPLVWAAVAAAILIGTAIPGAAGPVPGASETSGRAEIQQFFAEYLRLHAAKAMEAWQALFLPEAICVRTGSDGRVSIHPIAELARGIAETAKTLASQHETFEEVRIELRGDAAVYSTTYSLFHNRQKIQQGRAFFSLIKQGGRWHIAALVWYRD